MDVLQVDFSVLFSMICYLIFILFTAYVLPLKTFDYLNMQFFVLFFS